MKIAFLTRVDAFSKGGGDTYQLEMYKKHLELKGIYSDIITDLKIPLGFDKYIIVNLDRPLEYIVYFDRLKKLGLLDKTYLLSIHHSYKSINNYEINSSKGLKKILMKVFSNFHAREKIKSIVRSIKSPILLKPTLKYLFNNHYGMIRDSLKFFRTIIIIAPGEKNVIEDDFNVRLLNTSLVMNGVDIKSEYEPTNIEKEIDVLVCGRIEPRKNSLSIAQALDGSLLNVVFVGGINTNSPSYASEFDILIKKSRNLSYIGKVSPEELSNIYRKSKVHLSASWFEVASLVDLEAYTYGCNVVSSINGHTRDYLNSGIYIIDPANLSNLKDTLNDVMRIDSDPEAQYNFIARNYSWERSVSSLISAL